MLVRPLCRVTCKNFFKKWNLPRNTRGCFALHRGTHAAFTNCAKSKTARCTRSLAPGAQRAVFRLCAHRAFLIVCANLWTPRECRDDLCLLNQSAVIEPRAVRHNMPYHQHDLWEFLFHHPSWPNWRPLLIDTTPKTCVLVHCRISRSITGLGSTILKLLCFSWYVPKHMCWVCLVVV